MQDNYEKFLSYIDRYVTGERKDLLKKLYVDHTERIMLMPAASVDHHHNTFPGGYVDHVNRVVEASLVLDKVWERFGQKKTYTIEELVFSAINHDLGKMGTNEEPFYLPNDSSWHVEKQGAYFKINTNMTNMRVADRSLYYLQQANIPVTENEFLAIKLHDGLYEEANKPYYITYSSEVELKCNLPYILHQADLMASRVETQI